MKRFLAKTIHLGHLHTSQFRIDVYSTVHAFMHVGVSIPNIRAYRASPAVRCVKTIHGTLRRRSGCDRLRVRASISNDGQANHTMPA